MKSVMQTTRSIFSHKQIDINKGMKARYFSLNKVALTFGNYTTITDIIFTNLFSTSQNGVLTVQLRE